MKIYKLNNKNNELENFLVLNLQAGKQAIVEVNNLNDTFSIEKITSSNYNEKYLRTKLPNILELGHLEYEMELSSSNSGELIVIDAKPDGFVENQQINLMDYIGKMRGYVDGPISCSGIRFNHNQMATFQRSHSAKCEDNTVENTYSIFLVS